MNIILFGFKGSGKTHFGKLLARDLKRTFLDTDDLLEAEYKVSTEKLHSLFGEKKFREIEAKMVRSLENLHNSVISLGGGAVLDTQSRALIQKLGHLVYLDCPFESLRIFKEPSFAKEADLQEIYNERKPIYESIPALRIKVTELTESEIVKMVKEAYGL